MKTDNDALPIALAVLDHWREAYATGEPQAMAALYAEDCLHYGGRPCVYVGTAGVLEYFATLAARRHCAVRFDNVLARRLGPGAVHLACIAVFTVDDVTRPMRLTQTLTLENGKWKVASHHASPVPA
ncbi:MAG: SgcJ/EcaC family oxidoreductase [Burkholderiales bacterium]